MTPLGCVCARSVAGVRFFTCGENHGAVVKPSLVVMDPVSAPEEAGEEDEL